MSLTSFFRRLFHRSPDKVSSEDMFWTELKVPEDIEPIDKKILNAFAGKADPLRGEEALAEFLTAQLVRAQEEANAAAQRVLLLETAIERLRKDENTMEYNVTIKTLPERYYLYSKMTDGTDREIYMKSSRLIGQLMKAEPEAVYHFAVLQHRSNIDAGQYNSYDNTMVLLGKQPFNIPYRTLAPGRYLTGYHKGAWDTVGEAYERMLAYSREQAISLQEEFVERYVIDGFTASSEEDFITEITVGIAEEGE